LCVIIFTTTSIRIATPGKIKVRRPNRCTISNRVIIIYILEPVSPGCCDRCISACAILLSIKLVCLDLILAIILFDDDADTGLYKSIDRDIIILIINICGCGQAAIIVAEPKIFLGGIGEGATGDWRDYLPGLGVVPPVTYQNPCAAV